LPLPFFIYHKPPPQSGQAYILFSPSFATLPKSTTTLRELKLRGIEYKNQVWVPLEYKGLELDTELRLDVLVENLLCVELKAQQGLLPILGRSIAFLHANVAKTKRHSNQFSLCKYFQGRSENTCEQFVFLFAGRIIKTM
jgi:hypothetical protein